MKRKLAILLCLMLTAVMTLTGCATEKDKILGTWKGTVDLAKAINASLSEEDEISQYLNVEDLNFDMTIVFNEDDTYSLTVDRTELTDLMNQLLVQLEAGMVLYIEDLLKAEGIDMSVDDFLALLGMSFSDILASAFSEEMMDEILGEIDQSGVFAVEDGKLFLSEDGSTEIDKSLYELYTIEGDTLTISAGTALEGDEMADSLYPMTFTKVK